MARRKEYGSIEPYHDDPGRYGQVDSRLFNQKCDEISTHVFGISNNASGLERALKQLGTAQDSLKLREKIHGTQQSTNHVITQTHELLKELASMAKLGTRQQRLQVERLRNELKDAISRYSKIQKKTAEKMRETMPTKRPTPAVSQQQSEQLIGWEAADEEEAERLAQQEQRKQQLQVQKEHIDFEIALYEEREERIRQIEADILDVNEIFKELASLVHEQGDMIDTIEQNVETAASEVEEANVQLKRASEYQKSARKKMCILVIVALVIVTIIVIIIVTSVKK